MAYPTTHCSECRYHPSPTNVYEVGATCLLRRSSLCWPTICRNGHIDIASMAMFAVPTADHDRPPPGDYRYRRREEAQALDRRASWTRKPKTWKDGVGRIILVCLVGRWSFCPSYAAIEPAPPRRRIIGNPCGGRHPGMARVYCLLVYNGSGIHHG